MTTKTEGGLRPQRIEFVRESSLGVTPQNPDWEYFSDNMQGFNWSPDPGLESRNGLGTPDVVTHFNGPEEHELTVSYDLQRFFVDAQGDPVDPAGDGITRDSNGLLPNSHTVVAREDKTGLKATETVNGSVSRDTRIFTVAIGCQIDTATLSGDPGSAQPIVPTLDYMSQKVRKYQVDQPSGSQQIQFVSSDNSDTTQSVTIENAAGTVRETKQLNGTTSVTTSATFDDVDTVYITDGSGNAATTSGNVTVKENGGVDLCVLYGDDAYGHGEGDSGIPATGTGSHASDIGTAYETIINDTITRGGADLGLEINSVELEVSNNIESREQIGTPRMGQSPGLRDVVLTSAVVGEKESVKTASEALRNVGSDIVWTLTGGTLTVKDARLTDPDEISAEVGQAAMSLNNGFTGEGLEVASS